jgi:integrase
VANRKVTLVRLCKTEKGWRRYPAVVGKNGRVRPGFVLVDGQEREYPVGRYQLRTYDGARMIYRDAGENAAAAATARAKAEHKLTAKVEAKAAGVKLEEDAPGRVSLVSGLRRFISAAEDRGSRRAAEAYRQAGEEFLKVIGKTYADEITPDDVLRHQRALRNRGLEPRTISNRHVCIKSFLRFLNLDTKALAPTAPKYEKRIPEIYSPEELKALFASITDEGLSLTYELLLKTGLREQEAVYLYWENIDFAGSKLKVRSKPELEFRIKDWEERDIPIPQDLVERLAAFRSRHPKTRLVTGTRTDRPNGKLLRTLKRLVNKARLACGQCNGCIEHHECEHWWLHKFRSTCITLWLRSGLDLRTVMKLSGHSDLASVMRYLSPAGDDAIKAKVNSMKWM